ncbi:hypothetical protein OsJ_26777 [Oryza sativa Japonica Group]|uniref:Uncharacterized protein n=1 Tax=Oryza sativa subsp. japonica TaxID=39947 RepID=Q6ZJB8_ORYSJ|nr:hypothetical protein OsJ_26777 [Oryza sativa Japonica Group]BAC57782.1 hypothetical protein [Oryza sativa Japonica Group]BAD01201.1 hypothetical protein [Oryza sativa Japonica Group]
MLMKKEFMVGIALDKTPVSVSVCFSTLKMILIEKVDSYYKWYGEESLGHQDDDMMRLLPQKANADKKLEPEWQANPRKMMLSW